MVDYKVGDTVICLLGTGMGDPYPPVKGEIYTIVKLYRDQVDIKNEHGIVSIGWAGTRFVLHGCELCNKCINMCKKNNIKECPFYEE